MSIVNGTTLEELMATIKVLNDQLSVDAVVTKPYRVRVFSCFGKHKWMLESDSVKPPQGTAKCGRLYSSLEECMYANREVETSLSAEDGVCVLCYQSADPCKTYDGKFVTHWVSFDPYIGLNINDQGIASFQMVSLELSEDEMAYVEDTGIAFRQKEILYPIMKESCTSISHYMTDRGVLANVKAKDAFMPTTAALCLANSLGRKGQLNLVTKKISDQVKIVQSACGADYDPLHGLRCLQHVMGKLDQIGLNSLTDWSVTKREITCNFTFQALSNGLISPDYQIVVRYVGGLVAGATTSITAFITFHDKPFIIFQNTQKKGRLMNGLEDAILKFAADYNECCDAIPFFSGRLPERLKRTLGVNRCQNIHIPARYYSVPELFTVVLDAVYASAMSPGVRDKVALLLYPLFQKVCFGEEGENHESVA